jgi:hypothetical protein
VSTISPTTSGWSASRSSTGGDYYVNLSGGALGANQSATATLDFNSYPAGSSPQISQVAFVLKNGDEICAIVVPEPASMLLIGLGLLLIPVLRRRC